MIKLPSGTGCWAIEIGPVRQLINGLLVGSVQAVGSCHIPDELDFQVYYGV